MQAWWQDTGRAAQQRLRVDPGGFWSDAAEAISWVHRPQAVDDGSRPGFAGGLLNTSYNALDRHVVAGNGEGLALVGDDLLTGARRQLSYALLLDLAARFGGVLQACGLSAGDHVLVDLPASPEAVIVMLGCARVGAVHTLVPPSLSPAELAASIANTRPLVAVTMTDGGGAGRAHSAGRAARLEETWQVSGHQPVNTVVLGRPGAGAPGERDLDWSTLMRENTVPPAACEPMDASAPLFALIGHPAADNPAAGPFTVALAWVTATVHRIGPGNTVLAPEGLHTAAAHSRGIYGPLLAGATTVLSPQPQALEGALAVPLLSPRWPPEREPLPPGSDPLRLSLV